MAIFEAVETLAPAPVSGRGARFPVRVRANRGKRVTALVPGSPLIRGLATFSGRGRSISRQNAASGEGGWPFPCDCLGRHGLLGVGREGPTRTRLRPVRERDRAQLGSALKPGWEASGDGALYFRMGANWDRLCDRGKCCVSRLVEGPRKKSARQILANHNTAKVAA